MMRPDGPSGGRRPEEVDIGDIAAGITSDDDRLSPHVPLRTSKSRRNATALYAPSLDAPDPSEAAAAAAAVAAMPSVTPTGPFDPASAALKPRRNAYAMYSTDGAQTSSSGGGSGETAAVAAAALAGGGAHGGEDSRNGSRSAPLLQMAAAVLGGGTVPIAGEGHGDAAAAGAAGALWSDDAFRTQRAAAAGAMQQRPHRLISHDVAAGIAVGANNHNNAGLQGTWGLPRHQQQGSAAARLNSSSSQSLPDAAARLVAGLQLPDMPATAGQHQTAAGATAGVSAAAGAASAGSSRRRGEPSTAAADGADIAAAAPWGRRAGSEPAWREEDEAAAAAAPTDAETAAGAAADMDYAADDHAASAPLPVLMEGGVPLTLPPPVSVQVSSRSRKTVDLSGKGKLTLGMVGVFHPQLYMKGGDCIEVDGKMISRGKFEKMAGTATAKWHVSIKVLPSGTTIGKWLQQHGLPVLQGRPRKRRAASPLHDEDTDEPDEDIPEDDGSGDEDDNNPGSNRSSRRASRRDSAAAGGAGGAVAVAGGGPSRIGGVQALSAGGIGLGGTVALLPAGASPPQSQMSHQQQQQHGGGSSTPLPRLSVPGVSGGGAAAFARRSGDPRLGAAPVGTVTISQGLVDTRQGQAPQPPRGMAPSMYAAGVKLDDADGTDDDMLLSLLDTAGMMGDDTLPPPESGDLLVSAASQPASGSGFGGTAAYQSHQHQQQQQQQQLQLQLHSAPQQDASAQQRLLEGLRSGTPMPAPQQHQMQQQMQQFQQQQHSGHTLHPLLRGETSGVAGIGGGNGSGGLRSYDAQAGSADIASSELAGMYGSGFASSNPMGSASQQWAFSAPGHPVSADNANAFLLRQQLMQQQRQQQRQQQMPALGGLTLQHQQSLGLQGRSSGGFVPLQHARSSPAVALVTGGGSPAVGPSHQQMQRQQQQQGAATAAGGAFGPTAAATTTSLPASGSMRAWGQVGAATFESMMAGAGQGGSGHIGAALGAGTGSAVQGYMGGGTGAGGAVVSGAAAAAGASLLGGGSVTWGRAGGTAGAAAAGGGISGMFGFADGGSAATSGAGTAGRALACGSIYTFATGGLTSTTTIGGYSEDAFNRRSSILSNTPLELPSPPPPLGLQDVEMLAAVAQRITVAGSGGSMSSDVNTAAGGGGGGGAPMWQQQSTHSHNSGLLGATAGAGGGGRVFQGGMVQTVRPQHLHTSASGGYSGGVSMLGGGGAGSGPLPSLLVGDAPSTSTSMPQHDDFSQQLQHDLIRPAKGRRLGDFFDSADASLGLGSGAAGAAAAPVFGGSGSLTLAGSGNLSQGQLQQLQLQLQMQQLQPSQVTMRRDSSSAAATQGSGVSNDGSGGYSKQQSFAAMRSMEERAAALMRPRAPQAAAVPTAGGLMDAFYQQQQQQQMGPMQQRPQHGQPETE
ncbi:hypothetical protein HXX76_013461 [Chlamydomonas incerta]|uniref:Uncharacterized protein n=1 Tax=Chlamydomonas incerta TaxID=51695 RepID=A0A835SJ10_CHLIN|nr:hypothetical protein HXX76_013461 [Chlamydomonas incerta]|eukprot:KAG2425837.1 hypothetical protein HXX76_013461 [Chlamydomonas incerta]